MLNINNIILEKIKVYKSYTKDLLLFSLPIMLGHLSHILMGTVDTLVAARHNLHTISVVSIANSIFFTIFIMGIGLMLSISPLLSNFLGGKRQIEKYFFSGLIYSLALGIIFCILNLSATTIIPYFGFEKHLLPGIKNYITVIAFSSIGAYLHFYLKEYLQAKGIIFIPNAIAFFAVFLNLILNILFIKGCGFIPPIGETGLALATFIVRTLMGLSLLIYCVNILKIKIIPQIYLGYLKKIFLLSIPLSFAILFEFLAFNIITILIGRISGNFAAANSIILTLSSITFMIPQSISNALSVKVGFANGAKDLLQIKRYSLTGIFIATVFMALCAFLFIKAPTFFISIFSNETIILNIAVPIMFLVGLYQIADGLQVIFSGILRGLKITNLIMIITIFSYWVIGIPSGIFFAFFQNKNLYGFWLGITIALFFSATIFSLILIYIYQKKLKPAYSTTKNIKN